MYLFILKTGRNISVLNGKRPLKARLVLPGLFISVLLLFPGCGWNSTGEIDRLKREIADLTAENDKSKTEAKQMQSELTELRNQNADLYVQIVSLQEKNQVLQKEIDTLKEQLREKRR
jgi:septal ring factor EnvC (AmiA/AmiB activator)